MTAVKFGLELASQSTARRGAKEAMDARTALRKKWVGVVEKLGPGYHTARGAEMPDWVAVAHLPSYKIRRILHKWSIEVPRALMPNRQGELHSFISAAGARGPPAPAPLPTPAAAPSAAALDSSASTGGSERAATEAPTQPSDASTASRSAASFDLGPR